MDPVFIPLSAIVLGIAFGFFGFWTHHRQKMLQMQIDARAQSAGAIRAGEQDARIEELEERLRVVERIVTDPGYDVATQIEALRDQRRVEDMTATPAEAERLS